MQNTLFEREVDSLSKLRPLWPSQSNALTKVREAIRKGHKRIILQAPTGWGKTLWAAHIIAAALRKESRPLFTCPAISLVDQTLLAFEKEGIRDIGVMQAQHSRTNRDATVQIASVQTLIRRAAPDVDFALIDEAHESFDGLETMLDSEEWKNKVVIGLSATPWAKGMGLRWTKLVVAATINDLIADGHATPAVIYGPEHDVNRGAVTVSRGEFEEASSAAAMSDDAIVGDVLKEWKEKSPQEKTFVFCVNRAHAQTQMEAFLDDGIPFGYIDANTPQGTRDNEKGTRKHAFAQMRNGEIAGIASVGCLIRGVDEDVRCIVDLQLTKSEMRHVQKWGRGVRCAEGKEILVGLDHAGNNHALGLFTDIYHDHLDMRKPGDRGESYKDDYKPAKPRKCAKCHNLIPPKMRNCPSCNERVPLDTGVTVVDGRLVEIGSGPKIDMKERQDWYSGFLWLARQKNLKDGWAANSYREKFGDWPRHLRVRAKAPSEAVVEYAKQRREEYLKRIAVPVAVPAPQEEVTA
jgi:superfamily II DNA or RNA helicase